MEVVHMILNVLNGILINQINQILIMLIIAPCQKR